VADFICECNSKTVDVRNYTIRVVEGKGVVHDVQCEECGEHMTPVKKERNYTKEGVASLGRMNKSGSSY